MRCMSVLQFLPPDYQWSVLCDRGGSRILERGGGLEFWKGGTNVRFVTFHIFSRRSGPLDPRLYIVSAFIEGLKGPSQKAIGRPPTRSLVFSLKCPN